MEAAGEIQFLQIVSTQGASHQGSLGHDEFNNFYDFKSCHEYHETSFHNAADGANLLINLDLHILLDVYCHFTLKDLQSITKAHHLYLPSKKKADVFSQIERHHCDARCARALYLFRSRTRPRLHVPPQLHSVLTGLAPNIAQHTDISVQPSVADTPPVVNDLEHLTPPDLLMKKEIITEWEAACASEKVKLVVCAVCGTRQQRAQTVQINSLDVDLSILRNDELPEHIRPHTYNFIAYDRAILNPKGLESKETRGRMTICQPCAQSLCSNEMPKFALCNWLYYAKENLPGDIQKEFAAASMFERMLISRARCNSICCKFKVGSDDTSNNPLSQMRKGIRGNIMVAPLDALRLYDILPQNVSECCDTMATVLVANSMPSRSTISKLGPVLVRKSRIQKLLNFLVQNNPHYSEQSGLRISQDNLNAIHQSGNQPDIPSSVSIAQMPNTLAFEGATSDYTPRNQDEFIESHRLDELVMENVSYTQGDQSADAYHAMKLLALQRCLSGKPFLISGTGSSLVPDFNNPRILSWLFPHLDPWGIGGFYDPRRRKKITMKEQLYHMLRSDDVTFEEDPEFAFVFYNTLRKSEVSRAMSFQVPDREHERIINDLREINIEQLTKLCKKFANDSRYKPVDMQERKIMDIMRSISCTTRSLPGSNGYKKLMRDQIRSIIHARGSPTLFITINPSDVDHPLVRIFAGEDLDLDDVCRGEDMDSWKRKVFAARKPAASALFFDFMIQNFIKVILKPHTNKHSLYGICDAYYGTVEAQGKGTLHCHMLIWLRGHLPPEELREQLLSSPHYRESVLQWLQSIISNDFPLTTRRYEDEPDRSQRVRSKDLGEPHPGTVITPSLTKGNYATEELFWLQYKECVIRLLNEYNWHEHTPTCFKYLKPGQPRNDATCRVRMDGILHLESSVDEETGAIHLKRMHAKLSSYTDLIIFLLKCNMNIQFVGSGNAARAFLYYVTDYVTKSDIPLHEGLAAVAYVLKKTSVPKADQDSISQSHNPRALTKIVNAMMGKQEISHQQVMSYLVGGGDHYTSETFHNLYLGAFIRHLSHTFPALDQHSSVNDDEEPTMTEGEGAIRLTVEKDDVSINSQVLDYLYRPNAEPFNSMSLYEFVALTSKAKMDQKDDRLNSPNLFSSWDHPQRANYKITMRSKPVHPVVLGPSIPNRHASEASLSTWCKFMLIMLKPWRIATDLKLPHEPWFDAYSNFEQTCMPPHLCRIAKNMSLLAESKDVAFRNLKDRLAQLNIPDQTDGVHIPPQGLLPDDNIQQIEDEDLSWRQRLDTDILLALENLPEGSMTQQPFDFNQAQNELTAALGRPVTDVLSLCYDIVPPSFDHVHLHDDSLSVVTQEQSNTDHIAQQRAVMTLKRKRALDPALQPESATLRKRQRKIPPTPFVKIDILAEQDTIRNRAYHAVVEDIIQEMNLADNKEQLQAFLTIAHHHGNRNPEQLLMFVSGVGGTGKSHVIKSVVKLFERTQNRASLLLGAPTGSAAILIGGSTLHSLILENPNSSAKKNLLLLTAIWKDVSYLIVDEVSMIGALFLSKLSLSICRAKGDDDMQKHKLFGGINVIFMGDVCQLKPPKQKSLYSADIVKNPAFANYANDNKIGSMHGIFIWRQLTDFIELTKNCRHANDQQYAEFLSRVRIGKCLTRTTTDGRLDDYTYLQSRLLSNIQRQNPDELRLFADAPIIVGKKDLRDLLNLRLSAAHAKRLNKDIKTYYAIDFCAKQRVTGAQAEYLLNLESTKVRDSLGRLNLFEGMKVMVTDNIALDSQIVNGSEGVVRKIVYKEDDNGRRYAVVVYIHIEGLGFKIENLEQDVVPVFPIRVQIRNDDIEAMGFQGSSFARLQIPLVPAYSYTDFKSQGRTLTRAIVDIQSARGQGIYVMLSRVTSLSGIAVLRWFPESRIYSRLSQELRDELLRLNLLKETAASV
ncbi:hypothetical protein CVT26_009855 [Gymnopilus dilepis]|uniref:ATP-dependent DNA helicase n=1 Tax=Gymnopilus dilepis TaxID=231916 RepID=A0A409YC54_9AGAR|nr:hypothetical protein CVT26_009855 [Gymnopilus dilepis]